MLEPGHRLQEGLLFGKLDLWIRGVSSHGKTVFNTTEKVNLVLLPSLFQHLFRFMAFGCGEDGVSFCKGKVSMRGRKLENMSLAYQQQRCSEAP